MEDLGISAIHPPAPEFFSAVALFKAPIDIDAAVARLNTLWSLNVEGKWQTVEPDPAHPQLIAGKLLHFSSQGVQAMMTPLNYPLQPDKGSLPAHTFHIPITLYAPGKAAAEGTLAGEQQVSEISGGEIRRRKRMVSAHILLTQLSDALMREEAAVGIFRYELGVVQPPQMVAEMSESLTAGQVPLPLWVNIRTQNAGLTYGRTLGLPLFGHLDLEVRDSAQSADEVYLLLADIANYLITGSSYLIPGQTLGTSKGEKITLTQELSPFDNSPVIRVMCR